MDSQEVLNLVKAMKIGQNDGNLSSLFGGFQELLELQVEYNDLINQEKMPSEEDQHNVVSRMKENFKKMQENYGQFCKKTGKSPEEMKEYFTNSKNFSPKAWEELQNFNRRVEADQSPKIRKKHRKGAKKKSNWASI